MKRRYTIFYLISSFLLQIGIILFDTFSKQLGGRGGIILLSIIPIMISLMLIYHLSLVNNKNLLKNIGLYFVPPTIVYTAYISIKYFLTYWDTVRGIELTLFIIFHVLLLSLFIVSFFIKLNKEQNIISINIKIRELILFLLIFMMILYIRFSQILLENLIKILGLYLLIDYYIFNTIIVFKKKKLNSITLLRSEIALVLAIITMFLFIVRSNFTDFYENLYFLIISLVFCFVCFRFNKLDDEHIFNSTDEIIFTYFINIVINSVALIILPSYFVIMMIFLILG